MASYNTNSNRPRQSSPVSQYLDGLNMIPAAASNPNFDAETSLFGGNNQFFDFPYSNPVSAHPNDPDATAVAAFANISEPMNPFAEFTHFSPGPALSVITNSPFASLPSTANQSMNTSPANGIQAGPPSLQSRPTVPTYSHFQKHFDNIAIEPVIGDKRNAAAASLPSVQDMEEQSRLAAEEDKRRRNTAASARFRVKKKQREQALERSAKDMGDKVHNLETRVNELEMENKWLKEMLIEKNKANASIAGRGAPATTAVDDAEESAVTGTESASSLKKEGRSSDLSNKVAKQVEIQHRKRGIGTSE